MEDKEVVSVKIDTDGRSLVFGDVVVRVSPKFALAMHIDTDESNACLLYTSGRGNAGSLSGGSGSYDGGRKNSPFPLR